MIAVEQTALILLAAGRSERFGAADKLAEPLLGLPLAFHSVTALAALPFASRIAVVSGTTLDFAAHGFRVVENPVPALGQAGSLRLGVAAAREAGAAAVLVVLADMPRVTAAQVWRLFDASGGPETVVASSDGIRPCPPALFGAAHFATLEALQGDTGARALLRTGVQVACDPFELVDVDTRAQLEAVRAKMGSSGLQ